jgi:predicted DNA-binding ArsR family transcriptional regulator
LKKEFSKKIKKIYFTIDELEEYNDEIKDEFEKENNKFNKEISKAESEV